MILDHNGRSYPIKKDSLFITSNILDNISGNGQIGIKNQTSESDFKLLVDYVEFEKFPSNDEDCVKIMKMLSQYRFPQCLISHLVLGMAGNEKDTLIIRNNKEHYVSRKMMSLYSNKFFKHYEIEFDLVFKMDDPFSDSAFQSLLNYIHHKKDSHPIEETNDILLLADSLDCPIIKSRIIENWQTEIVIMYITCEQLENQTKSKEYEKIIADRIDEFIDIESFYHIPFPSLCRIFQSSNKCLSDDHLTKLFTKLHEKHGLVSNTLFSLIKKESRADNPIENGSLIDFQSKKIKKLEEEKEKEIYDLKNKLKDVENSLNTKIEEISNNYEELSEKLKRRDEENIKLHSEIECFKEMQNKLPKNHFDPRWEKEKPPKFIDSIHDAINEGSIESIIYLLANGTSVNEKNDMCPLKLI